jgi:ribosomal protein S14
MTDRCEPVANLRQTLGRSTAKLRCSRCGGPGEVLVAEDPDVWLCRACADQLGRDASTQDDT